MGKINRRLNKNSIPFLLLGLLHMAALVFMLSRKKPKGAFTLLITNMGLAYLFEYVVLNLFKGYKYKPSLMKNNTFDSILGAIMSQGLYVPVSATLLTLFKAGWRWKFGLSIAYYFVEKLFLWLKVYKVFWWRPLYTIFFLNAYFFLSDHFYRAISAQKNWALKVSHYMAVEVIGVTLLYFAAVRNELRFGWGKLYSLKEHFIIVPIYSLVLSYIAAIFSPKSGLVYRLFHFSSYIFIDIILMRSGILKIKKSFGMIRRHLLMVFLSRILYKKINAPKDGNDLKQ